MMWGLWFFPLVSFLFVAAAAATLVWYLGNLKTKGSKRPLLLAIPFGCAAIPVVGLLLLVLVSGMFQKNDAQLYEEVFGEPPPLTEDRMLFDDFGSSANREILMRGEPTDAERAKLLSIPGAVPSEYTFDQFVARGEQHGFTWWLSSASGINHCKSARILDAPGFNDWVEFRIAECLDSVVEIPASSPAAEIYIPTRGRQIYVIASGRSQ